MDKPTLKNAKNAAEVIEAMARRCWYLSHDCADCPGDKIPTQKDLAKFLAVIPDKDLIEADRILRDMNNPDRRTRGWIVAGGEGGPSKAPKLMEKAPEPPDRLMAMEFDPKSRTSFLVGLYDLNELWKGCGDRRHPLEPIVRAWQERPLQVQTVTRRDPILPVLKMGGDQQGLPVLGLTSNKNLPAQLPLLPEQDGPRVALLELADLSGLATMRRGRGVPMQLKLATGLTLFAPFDVGHVEIILTVRQLRDWIYPSGFKDARRSWGVLRKALYGLNVLSLPFGKGRWLPFSLRYEPGVQPHLDDEILVEIRLPPGSTSGPIVDLNHLAGIQSAPEFRANIAAKSLIWHPGLTRVPAGGGRQVWTRQEDKYPILTTEDRRRLAFGAEDAKHRTQSEQNRPWQQVPGLRIITQVTDPQTGKIGWRILPDSDAPKRGVQCP